MALQQKSMVFLGGALLVGFALGLFADSSLIRARRDRRARRPVPDQPVGTLSDRIGEAIQPHDAAQLDSLRPAIQKVSDDNRAVMDAARSRTRAHTDSLRIVLGPMLDSAQRGRLDRELARLAARRNAVNGTDSMSRTIVR